MQKMYRRQFLKKLFLVVAGVALTPLLKSGSPSDLNQKNIKKARFSRKLAG